MAQALLMVLCGVLLLLLFVYLAGSLRRAVPPEPQASLLIVVRNQAPVIEGLVRAILSYYHTLAASFQLVVVDDRSGDETPLILERLQQRHNFTLVLTGTGSQPPLRQGLQACKGQVIIYFNLTGGLPPRRVVKASGRLLSHLPAGI